MAESNYDRRGAVGRALTAGQAAHQRHDYAAAFRFFAKAAAAGDPEGQYRFGTLYARGHGVLANFADAIAWYRRAAEQGHAEAQYQLSLAHLHGCGAAHGVDSWYRAAAQRD